MLEVNFEEILCFPMKIFPSFCITHECDHATAPYLGSIICKVATYGRLETKENLKLLVLKVVAVAYERWSLITSSKFRDLS